MVAEFVLCVRMEIAKTNMSKARLDRGTTDNVYAVYKTNQTVHVQQNVLKKKNPVEFYHALHLLIGDHLNSRPSLLPETTISRKEWAQRKQSSLITMMKLM